MHEKNGDHCLELIYASSEQSGHYRKKKLSKTKSDGIFIHKFRCTLSTKLTKNKLLD